MRRYLLLERLPLLESQAVGLGDNRHNIDNFAQFLHHYYINGTK